MWAPWMLFLAYPALAAANADGIVDTVTGLALTAAFASVYAWWMRAAMTRDLPAGGETGAAVGVGLLVAISVAYASLIGPEALSFAPFLVAFATFGLVRPWAWVVDGLVVAVSLAVALTSGDLADWAPFLVILFAVTGGTVAGRVMADHGEEVARVGEQLAIASERERVARDVHDVLGHSLTVIAVKTELAARLLDREPARASAELAEVQDLARQALAEVRSTVGGLRAAGLEDELAAARSALAAADVRLEVIGSVADLDPRHRTAAGWIVREAVTNVVRHAHASRCEIGMGADRLWVTDDGVGVDVDAGRASHGLRGLEERVRSSGGALTVGGASDGRGGTRVEVTW